MISEDKLARWSFKDYHDLVRKDNNYNIETDVISVNKTRLDESKYIVEFKVAYEVKTTTDGSFDLEFMLANKTTFREGFGTPFRQTVGIEWYKVQLDDGSYLFLSHLGPAEAGSSDPVVALVPSGPGYMLASLNNGAWNNLGQVALDPDFGIAVAGFEAGGEIVSSQASWIKLFIFNDLVNYLIDEALLKAGLSRGDIDNLDQFFYGVADSFDDNYLYGAIKRFKVNVPTDYNDFYFLSGRVLVDASAVITFGGIAGTSDAIANANFARAAAEGAAGGLALATGVGAPAGVALAGDALGAVVIRAVGKVVAVSAAAVIK